MPKLNAYVLVSKLDGSTYMQGKASELAEVLSSTADIVTMAAGRRSMNAASPLMPRRASEWDGFEEFGPVNRPVVVKDHHVMMATWYPCRKAAAQDIGVDVSIISRALKREETEFDRPPHHMMFGEFSVYEMTSTAMWPKFREELLADGWTVEEPKL